jgi:hypothetical protein
MTREQVSVEGLHTLPRGSTALDVLFDQKSRNRQIRKMRFVSYPDAPGFEERCLNDSRSPLSQTFSRAATLAKLTNCDVPLWEFAWLMANTPEVFDRLVAQALEHNTDERRSQTFSVEASSLSPEWARKKLEGQSSHLVLAFCSKCQLADDSLVHIPMMDFRCEPCPTNQQKVESALRGIGQRRGYILNSGRSYHYYGLDLVDEISWIEFMAKNLLLSPLTDSRYIAHRLIDGTCALRISTSLRHPDIPRVVAKL